MNFNKVFKCRLGIGEEEKWFKKFQVFFVMNKFLVNCQNHEFIPTFT